MKPFAYSYRYHSAFDDGDWDSVYIVNSLDKLIQVYCRESSGTIKSNSESYSEIIVHFEDGLDVSISHDFFWNHNKLDEDDLIRQAKKMDQASVGAIPLDKRVSSMRRLMEWSLKSPEQVDKAAIEEYIERARIRCDNTEKNYPTL